MRGDANSPETQALRSALVLPLQQDQSLHPDIAALADAVQKRSSLRNAAVIPFELSATS